MSADSLVSPLECPDSWRLVTLKSICKKIGSGATPTGGQAAYQQQRSNFALVRSQNVFDREFSEAGLAFISDEQASALKGVRLEPNDILLNITGDGITFGRACLVPGQILPACVNQHVSIIRLESKQANPGYLVSYLTHPTVKSYIESFNAGGSRRAITKAHIESFVVPLPPLPVQNEIADLLGSLDNRITLLRQTNATLEAIAQALFKSWFVDFDPVRAKMEGRAPDGMDEATAALFPEKTIVWPTCTVQALIQQGILVIGDGYRAKNDELGLPGVAFVRAGDLTDGRITPTRDYLQHSSAIKAGNKVAKPGDTVFTSKGTIGRFAFVPESAEQAVYSPQVCFWRSRDPTRLQPEYLHFWMRSRGFTDQIDQVRGQAAIMDFVSLANQKAMKLRLPSAELQAAFVDVVRPLLSSIASNSEQAETLTVVRDTLLPRLISGQLRLPEAIEAVEAAAA